MSAKSYGTYHAATDYGSAGYSGIFYGVVTGPLNGKPMMDHLDDLAQIHHVSVDVYIRLVDAAIKASVEKKLATWGPQLGANGPKNIVIPEPFTGKA